MKKRLIYIAIVVIASVGFFSAGWYLHQPVPSPDTMTPDGPYFTLGTPYLHTAYGAVGQPDSCPPTDTSDDYVCIYKLAHDTLDKADALAQKLLQSPTISPSQFPEFYKELPASIKSAQKARDAYFDGICDLDMMAIYGGSGMDLEREACRYYYAKQYLNVLQKIEMASQGKI